jgi:Tol biopolymer transport system component
VRRTPGALGLAGSLAALALPAPAGATLAYRDRDNNLTVANDDGTGARVLPHYAEYVSVSPNGRRVAYIRGEALHVTNAQGGHDRVVARRVRAPGVRLLPLPWAPDSRHVAVDAGAGYGSYIVDANTGKRRTVVKSYPSGGASFSPDSRRLLYEGGRSPAFPDLVVYSRRDRHRTRVGKGHDPAWGRRGFAFRRGKSVYFTPRPGRKPRRLLSSSHGTLFPVAWSANGRRLLLYQANHDEGNSFRALIHDMGTGVTQTLGPRFATVTAISRDGQFVLGDAFIDGQRDVIAARVDGTTAVLARDASYPSWSR